MAINYIPFYTMGNFCSPINMYSYGSLQMGMPYVPLTSCNYFEGLSGYDLINWNNYGNMQFCQSDTGFGLNSYNSQMPLFSSFNSYNYGQSYNNFPFLFNNIGVRTNSVQNARVKQPHYSSKVGANADFDKALSFVLKREGGYSNVKGDHPTNKGIIQSTYNTYLKKKGLAPKDVKYITDSEVREIYYTMYWQPCGCSNLPSDVGLFIFDTAVNMGVSRAKNYLNKYKNGAKLESLISERKAQYEGIAGNNPEKRKFLKGWENRMSYLEKEIAVA